MKRQALVEGVAGGYMWDHIGNALYKVQNHPQGHGQGSSKYSRSRCTRRRRLIIFRHQMHIFGT